MVPQFLIESIVAIALSTVQLFGWIALGSFFIRKDTHSQISLPVSILIGSAITAFFYAVLAAFGQIEIGIALSIFTVLIAAVVLRQRTLFMLREPFAICKKLYSEHTWVFGIWGATAVLYAVNALAPARDQDVLYYHLGHIRQIDMENSWLPIADYCYGFPFGWIFNYLPFEHFGFAQVSSLLNLGLWLILSPLLFALLRQYVVTPVAYLLCAVLIYHPVVLKMSTSAFADMYTIFVALALTAFIARLPTLKWQEFGLLGFSAWIGTQSRYQSIAIGLAITVLIVFLAWRQRITVRDVMSYCGGTLGALALSSPFYLFNFVAFNNPIWPLALPYNIGSNSYVDMVTAAYTKGMTGSLTPDTVFDGFRRFMITPEIFPVPILAVALIIVALSWRKPSLTTITIPVIVFLSLWVLTQPMLVQPRYILYLSPLILAGWALILGHWLESHRVNQANLVTVLGIIVFAFLGFGLFYSKDALQYVLTGDLHRYHQHTAFFEVFESVNRTTPSNAKLLVILSGGQTYYLNRLHRRADPEQSGVIDWPSLQSAEHLDQIIADGGYNYILYEDIDWGSAVGGTHLMDLLKESIRIGLLVKEAEFHPRVNESRVRRQSHLTTVHLLKRTR